MPFGSFTLKIVEAENILFCVCARANNELSSLAKGRGFFRQGVEVECFIDDIKAYTLSVSTKGWDYLESQEH